MSTVISSLFIVGGILIIGAFIWKKFGNNTSTAGQIITSIIDTTDALGAYTNLTLIRQLDSVESDAKAVEACDYLRNVVTAWKRPKTAAESAVVTVSVNGKTTDIPVA